MSPKPDAPAPARIAGAGCALAGGSRLGPLALSRAEERLTRMPLSVAAAGCSPEQLARSRLALDPAGLLRWLGAALARAVRRAAR